MSDLQRLDYSKRQAKTEDIVSMRAKRHAVTTPPRNAQNVVVQAHYSKDPNGVAGHEKYMEREGVGIDGEKPELFTEKGQERPDAKPLPGEERFYQVTISPENGNKMSERQFKNFVRDTMKETARATGQHKLQWTAAIHDNTPTRHAHVCVRGVQRDGTEVYMPKDFIKHGWRGVAKEAATKQLGHRTEREMNQEKKREITAERFTKIDRSIEAQQEKGFVRPANDRQALRLEHLSKTELATKNLRGGYQLAPEWKQKLRDRGQRNDIVKQMHKDLGKSAKREPMSVYKPNMRITGVVVKTDYENEIKKKPYAIIRDPETKRSYYWASHRLNSAKEGDKINLHHGKVKHLGRAEQEQNKPTERPEVTRARNSLEAARKERRDLAKQIGLPDAPKNFEERDKALKQARQNYPEQYQAMQKIVAIIKEHKQEQEKKQDRGQDAGRQITR